MKPHHLLRSNGALELGYSHLGMLAAARWLLKEAAPVMDQALKVRGDSRGRTAHAA